MYRCTLGHPPPDSETYTSRMRTHYIAENYISINNNGDGYLRAT
jgi:hypothetical protein